MPENVKELRDSKGYIILFVSNAIKFSRQILLSLRGQSSASILPLAYDFDVFLRALQMFILVSNILFFIKFLLLENFNIRKIESLDEYM